MIKFLNDEGSYLLTEIKAEDELQQSITLKLAETFINKILYLNVKADWRGRIYTESFFIDYQGSDLALALLNFAEGQILTDCGKDYLYIYGANNHNQSNISKDTYPNRIKWVKKNYKKIISLDKKLILSAENPFVFTAFCLTMRELQNNPNYPVKIPVFLDATCNGIQHLAAILQDLNLGAKVNLTSFNIEDKPKDFYSEVIESINKTINRYGEENKQYAHFVALELTRLILKLSIMTRVYNVTTFGIKDQIKSKLNKTKLKLDDIGTVEYISKELEELLKTKSKIRNKKNLNKKEDNKGWTVYLAPGKNKTKVALTNQDIWKIAEIVYETIFDMYPSLRDIYDYFIKISELMINLGIPLTWITPTGIKITQHYLLSKRKTVAIKFGGIKRKLILRESTDKLNKKKQIESIIPNIIHSLDSNHLISLINTANNENFSPIITVHDCFGTHPNKMGELNFRVKKQFVLLYTQEKFLETFHNRILQSIKDNNLTLINDSKVIFDDKELDIPSLPKLGELELERIIDAKYMIT